MSPGRRGRIRSRPDSAPASDHSETQPSRNIPSSRPRRGQVRRTDGPRWPEDEAAGRNRDDSNHRTGARRISEGQPQRVPQPHQPDGGGCGGLHKPAHGVSGARLRLLARPARERGRRPGPAPVAHFRLKDGRYNAHDVALLSGGHLTEPLQRYRRALERLSRRSSRPPVALRGVRADVGGPRAQPPPCSDSGPCRCWPVDARRWVAALWRGHIPSTSTKTETGP